MNFKKIINFFDSAGKIISLAGFGITAALIIIIKVFDVKVSDYLKEIPFIQYFINMDLIEAFEAVDEGDIFYVELQNNIEDFMKDSKNIENITVKLNGDDSKIFKITMKDGEERLITVTKDGDQFKFDMEIIRKLLLQKNADGTFIKDLNNESFLRMVEDKDYCLRCSSGDGDHTLNKDFNEEIKEGAKDETEEDISPSSDQINDNTKPIEETNTTPTEYTAPIIEDTTETSGGGGSSSNTEGYIYETTGDYETDSTYTDNAFGYGDSTVY